VRPRLASCTGFPFRGWVPVISPRSAMQRRFFSSFSLTPLSPPSRKAAAWRLFRSHVTYSPSRKRPGRRSTCGAFRRIFFLSLLPIFPPCEKTDRRELPFTLLFRLPFFSSPSLSVQNGSGTLRPAVSFLTFSNDQAIADGLCPSLRCCFCLASPFCLLAPRIA